VAIYVKKRVNLPPTCMAIELVNIPQPNPSPLMGSTIFKLKPNTLYNDHFAWTNGPENLSFIKHNRGDRGNWLLGIEAGVDSGYVFIEGPQYSKTPLGLESDTNKWKWLMDGSWQPQPQLRARCLDAFPVDHFYEVEYFDSSNTAQQSFVYVNSESVGFFFDNSLRTWVYLTDIETVAAWGQPVQINHPSGTGTHTDTAVLVNQEHAAVPGWRLTMRSLLSRDTHKEYSIQLRSTGDLDPESTLTPLTNTQQVLNDRRVVSELRNVKAGDYIWLWYTTNATSELVATRSELLAQCLTNVNDVIVFKYFPTHRLETMQQSILSQNVDMLVVRLQGNDHWEATLAGRIVDVHTLTVIGSALEHFIYDYIQYKEHTLTAVSACFLYHAAVSLPHPLVYAVEMMCLFAGGKPVTMVSVHISKQTNTFNYAYTYKYCRFSTLPPRTTSGSSPWCRKSLAASSQAKKSLVRSFQLILQLSVMKTKKPLSFIAPIVAI
jgi:hypothetical protein